MNDFTGCLHLDTDFQWSDISDLMQKKETIKQCIQLCYETKHCRAFIYAVNTEICYPKTRKFDENDKQRVKMDNNLAGNIKECAGDFTTALLL
jgi:hypothetical protein